MGKRRKKKKRRALSTFDYHHIFFQKRYWNKGYAKTLRECEYGGKRIPKNTLHREIHQEVITVPVPSGENCKLAFKVMLRAKALGIINPEKDSLEEMIRFYIIIWKELEPETVKALKKQLRVIKQYRGS